MFYSTPSTYIWTDQSGQTHPVQQAEGGEQGDPLMPALFSLALNTALQQFHEDLHDGERVAAYLDDIYITAQPSRIRTLFDALARHLSTHAGIRLHAGKTEVWNAGGVGPPNVQEFTTTTPMWLGNPTLPHTQQGLGPRLSARTPGIYPGGAGQTQWKTTSTPGLTGKLVTAVVLRGAPRLLCLTGPPPRLHTNLCSNS
jgi:hypothetical protein